MCTLTIIARPWGGYRLVHARDEQRSRGIEAPPAWREAPGGAVLCPTDPDAGGTWVALRGDHCSGVLNVNIAPNGRAEPTQSRGRIPIALMGEGSLGARRGWLQGADLRPYAPFTAFSVAPENGRVKVLLVRWDGLKLDVLRDPEDPFEPVCVASSGLGDGCVQCRVPLFDDMVRSDPTPEHQDAFHAHMWGDRPEVSVLMSREDARTTSLTTVEVTPGREPTMSHAALPEGEPETDPVGASLLHSRS